jgi:hypothetical protein
VEKYGRARQTTDDNIIGHMQCACWITKAIDTPSEYVTFIAFPWQQWLCECTERLWCEFFVWDWAKEEFYLSKQRSLDEREPQIWDSFATIPLDFLRKNVESMSVRLQQCVQSAGSYVEIWYIMSFSVGQNCGNVAFHSRDSHLALPVYNHSEVTF